MRNIYAKSKLSVLSSTHHEIIRAKWIVNISILHSDRAEKRQLDTISKRHFNRPVTMPLILLLREAITRRSNRAGERSQLHIRADWNDLQSNGNAT